MLCFSIRFSSLLYNINAYLYQQLFQICSDINPGFYTSSLIPSVSNPSKFVPSPIIHNLNVASSLWGITNSQALHGMSYWGRFDGYNPTRHDYYTYPSEIQNVLDSVSPTGLNTAWWNTGTDKKLDKCWIAGYQGTTFSVSGITYYIKVYDSFSPPDLSGCSIRPRAFSKPWIELGTPPTNWPIDLVNIWTGDGSRPFPSAQLIGHSPGGMNGEEELFGTARYHSLIQDIPNNWNLFNSGFWTNILITKKHALACKHFAGPNSILNNVQWIRRDGVVVTRNLTKIYAFEDYRYSDIYSSQLMDPVDLYLYELDSELTQDDLNNMSVYNVWPTVTGFTGSKLIDTRAYTRKGFTGDHANINYNDVK